MSVGASSTLREFVKLHPEVEAVVQHVGLRTWDLLLIDVDGNWVRDEFPSEEHAEAACGELGIRMHRGWDDSRMVMRLRRRDHWNRPGGQRRAL
ncbi:MAG: hypothetical protein ACRDHS_01405 [Actinomycetota bacterium]